MSSEHPRHIKKYLQKYGLNSWEFYGDVRKYKSIVVIPAIAEFENIRVLLNSLMINDQKYFHSTLILFIVNRTISSNDSIKEENSRTIQLLKQIIHKENTSDNLVTQINKSILQIGLVDASSEGFELNDKEGGVGLARKIGMDEALKLFEYSSSHKNIIICLDADCTVSKNYISTIRNSFDNNDLRAAYVNFSHATPDDIENKKAIINYEIFLRYYVLGLKFANSPFAYHSIGSAMVCDVDSYIKIQGMNKKKAAEDFYFMEKLSKITEIKKIEGATVFPSSRGSWRVPFGTGKRVSRFLENVQNEYLLYSPDSFVVLKKWIELFHSSQTMAAEDYMMEAKNICYSLYQFLVTNKFEQSWERVLKNTKSIDQISKQKKLWFDGFKTLKLIHHLRDNEFPSENMFDALDKVFRLMEIDFTHTNNPGKIPNILVQEKYLQKLRKIA